MEKISPDEEKKKFCHDQKLNNQSNPGLALETTKFLPLSYTILIPLFTARWMLADSTGFRKGSNVKIKLFNEKCIQNPI